MLLNKTGVDLYRHDPTVLGPYGEFVDGADLGIRLAGEHGIHQTVVLRWHQVNYWLSDEFVTRIATDEFPGAVDVDQPAGVIEHVEDVVGVLEHAAIPLL